MSFLASGLTGPNVALHTKGESGNLIIIITSPADVDTLVRREVKETSLSTFLILLFVIIQFNIPAPAAAFYKMFNIQNLFQDLVRPRPFIVDYQCYSISMFPGHDRQEVENGGKIFLPPSALQYLTQLNVAYPMLFKLTNLIDNRSTHCGVLEFVADEGKMYIPYWMMRNLMIDEGAMVQVESATLPVATFSKFEPQSSDFLEISNPKAMLENALRNFACLTAGDVIAIRYNDQVYEMRVLETRPGDAVNIIECDMNVEFSRPVGYVEPDYTKLKKKEGHEVGAVGVTGVSESTYLPFLGGGNRLDGKNVPITCPPAARLVPRDAPDFDFVVGNLRFCRNVSYNGNIIDDGQNESGFKPFGGSGSVLQQRPAKP
ncbi:Ubiquitin fusion degradation protein 1 [Orchesella cincta]|uniref:Ubiquitin fusion degradation protein 1 homolog n=1 Tax=Orchesella cincta TaxID=48709 RepID=A0A1D2MFG5_ORCCI|nr:Ubiquitin fusion degradation protein 1 [Orchesella cincta]